MKSFYNKHKTTIIMLSPLILGLLFFAYSGISGLITVNDAEIFENVQETPLQIGDFELREIDSKTNKLKWILKAINSQSDLIENQAEVDRPKLSFYDPDSNFDQLKFVITAERASFDKKQQAVVLRENVNLQTSDGKYELYSGHLKFKEDQPFLVVSRNWNLDSTEGFKISGDRGLISKDFTRLESQGSAKLSQSGQEGLNLSAKRIHVDTGQGRTVTAEQSAVLHLNDETDLFAEQIVIKSDGALEARGAVNVKAKSANCFSDRMYIEMGDDQKPARAIFTENPYIIQGINTIYADKIIYDFASEKVTILGNIHSD